MARAWSHALGEHDITAGQILLTLGDTENRRRYLNARTTIDTLLNLGAVPVINENDTVATEEIKFGDNDKLAALTADLMEADLLIMATNTYGLYDADPNVNADAQTILDIENLDEIKSVVGESKTELGSGGMKSKIEAAEIATKAGIETWLIYGFADEFLLDAMSAKVPLTKIRAQSEKI